METTERLQPPGPDARARLLELIAVDDAAAGRTPITQVEPDQVAGRIARWANDDIYQNMGFGRLLRVRHQDLSAAYCDFEPALAVHRGLGFRELLRWDVTTLARSGRSTTPTVLLVHAEKGILATLSSCETVPDRPLRASTATWFFNAAVTDTTLFGAIRQGACGTYAVRGSSIYAGAAGERVLAELPDTRAFFAGSLQIMDAGITDRMTILDATCTFITPWVRPAVTTLGFGSTARDLRGDGLPMADIIAACNAHTEHVLAQLPADVTQALGALADLRPW